MSQTQPIHQIPVVLVDDEAHMLLSSKVILQSYGIRNIITLSDSRKVLDELAKLDNAVVVLDLMMPRLTGEELLPMIHERYPHIPVIVNTATQELETAINCMRNGAFDYLVKPAEETRFVSCVKRAWETLSLRRQVGNLRRSLLSDEPPRGDAFSHIITRSRKMINQFRYIEAIGGTGEPVLITGETGVGKELFAEAVHLVSGLSGPFEAVNIAGLDGQMFSDTLFGHKKGAFTGADSNREGLISQAAGGTLFLDEIGDLQPENQVKLLRLLQERQYRPLGSDVPVSSDVRVVVATNQSLKKRMESGKFRSDLYYRLSVHHVRIPALRERKEDLPLLVDFFIGESAKIMKKKPPTPPKEMFSLLNTYHFPGNVRELRGLLFDSVARHQSKVLSLDSLREALLRNPDTDPPSEEQQTELANLFQSVSGPFPTLKEVEHQQVEEALRRTNGNQSIAAGLLGISRSALSHRLRKK
ncbi:MAG: sigma-54-dependent Fis family transcriptional regulator [Magnetococcales bacterium]|nr:sigma-54-dependent Fis family transcriptional regulator [Magnetococcales bacterium]